MQPTSQFEDTEDTVIKGVLQVNILVKSIVNKIKICEGEASETQYWLEIIIEVQWLSKAFIEPLYTESSELLAIFTSIGHKK